MPQSKFENNPTLHLGVKCTLYLFSLESSCLNTSFFSLTGWFSLIWSYLLEHPNIEIVITKCSFDNHSWNPFKILMVDNSGYMNSNCRTFIQNLFILSQKLFKQLPYSGWIKKN